MFLGGFILSPGTERGLYAFAIFSVLFVSVLSDVVDRSALNSELDAWKLRPSLDAIEAAADDPPVQFCQHSVDAAEE